jgi:hypothetical protein
MHARSGGKLEVMGVMMGKIDGNTMIVTDTFALPVEGTETRVNAQVEAYEYMVEYVTLIKQVCDLYFNNIIHPPLYCMRPVTTKQCYLVVCGMW